MSRTGQLGPPASLLARLRWFFLLFSLFFLATFSPQVTLQSQRPLGWRVLATGALLALGAWYLRCYRQARFPAVGLLLEAAAFVLAVLVPDDPFKALGLLYISVNFRALYGTWRQVLAFTVLALVCFSGAIAVAAALGGPNRLSLLEQSVPGVPVLAVIAHLVAVASDRSERAAARERVLSRSGAAIALASDEEEVLEQALAAVYALAGGLPAVSAAVVPHEGEAAPGDSAAGRLSVPLRTRDRHLGALRVESAGELPLEVRDALVALAAQLAMGLANAALTADLRHRATHDPLTGLANRRLLDERLHEAVTAGQGQEGDGPAVLLLDLDGFKQVNDAYGHSAGDALLVAVAQRLRQLVRGVDLVARLGGDEFVVLLDRPACTADATALADRVRAHLCRPVPLPGGQLAQVGVSLGLVTATAGSTAEQVLHDADAAMYDAKRRGRAPLVDRRDPGGKPDAGRADVPHPRGSSRVAAVGAEPAD